MPGLAIPWLLFPLLLLALCTGCGLLAEAVLRRRVPGALVPAVGFAVMIVVGESLVLSPALADLTAPAAAALAVAGLTMGRHRLRGVGPWAAAAGIAVFAIYAAPVVLSGEPTIAGFIKLDDTATWLALTDRVMEHGRSLEGLAPSSYEATLHFNLADGYPIGVFLPLGAAASLLGEDVAWVIQPYLAFLASLLALALWELGGLVVSRPWTRAVVATVAAQPALLFGYYLWGGIKELAAAMLVATAAALAPVAVRAERRLWMPLALVAAATAGVLSPGGLLWLAPVLLVAGVAAARGLGLRPAGLRALAFAAAVALLSLPVLLTGVVPPTSSPLTSDEAKGNLIEPLDPVQIAGIWPAGDFRLPADAPAITGALIAVAVGAAAFGLLAAWRRRAWAPPTFALGALATATGISAFGSPWVDGKALAIASAALPFLAALGGAALWARGRHVGGVLVLAAIAGGVAWSNALAYREVNLAPSGQLAELAQFGEQIAGEGPAMMSVYEPYGVRHFLREADAEGVSELRRNSIPLRSGDTVPKGGAADTDRLDPKALLAYRTLVLRRSPLQSRPPAPYELVAAGGFYEVWQRPPRGARWVQAHLGLGRRLDPAARPDCARIGRIAGNGAPWLAAVRRERPLAIPKGGSGRITIRRAGEYEIWLGGSVRGEARVLVDGDEAGSARHELNNQGQYVRLGAAALSRGVHEIEVVPDQPDLHPGSGGPRPPRGPLLLTRTEAADAEIEFLRPRRAQELCGRRWDWVAALERRG